MYIHTYIQERIYNVLSQIEAKRVLQNLKDIAGAMTFYDVNGKGPLIKKQIIVS